MKIAILTQPLHNNYGGLLQAYALQRFLLKQGHEVYTVDFSFPEVTGVAYCKVVFSNIIRKYILRRHIPSIFPVRSAEKRLLSRHTARFIAERIRLTQRFCNLSELEYLSDYQFDAFIVGSDQVWRPAYSPGIEAFFLSFLKEESAARRIAYAASFGLDDCSEFDTDKLNKLSELLQLFDEIGVRESSGVDLCERFFGAKGTMVLDPTLLLQKEDYYELLGKGYEAQVDDKAMLYVLDRSPDKQEIIDYIVDVKRLKVNDFLQEKVDTYSPVDDWLKGFMCCEFVLTDSFHGVVFSIIFNKPFIVIANSSRGLARFNSILKKFGLMSQMVFSIDDVSEELINSYIDFEKVNSILEVERNRCSGFLVSALIGGDS